MLNGRKVVISGGSRGIGKAIALTFAKNGADVAILYSSNKSAAESVCGECARYGAAARIYRCEVSDAEAVEKVSKEILDEFGSVDILVNNAGITKDKLIIRMSEQDFSEVVDVNLKGSFYLIKYLSRSLMKSSFGRIINITSVSGISGNIGQANYSSAKAGLIGLTKTAAREFAGRSVTCNAIAPGFIITDMTAEIVKEAKERIVNSIPLNRMGSPAEVADLALFLASDAASYITGEVIKIDGGICI